MDYWNANKCENIIRHVKLQVNAKEILRKFIYYSESHINTKCFYCSICLFHSPYFSFLYNEFG